MEDTPGDVAPKAPLIETIYLGDGVYAGFDGRHITLAVNSHHAYPAVFLDHAVWAELVRYGQRLGWASK